MIVKFVNARATIVCLIAMLSSCVSIPRQAPLLSQELGNRISVLEKSHINILNSYFDHKRKAVDDFMENVWLPEFASTFFSKPEIEEAWKEIVESDDKQGRLEFLLAVGPELQVVINEKRQELVAPLDELERELESAIREEYNMARSMNNTLTSFLTSAAKVKENQQRYLDMLKITDDKIGKAIDQTDKIVSELLGYAQQVAEAESKIRAYTLKAEEYKIKLNELKDKINK
jgi:SMC interacting uncharacterized protein involved in chromosome segregation